MRLHMSIFFCNFAAEIKIKQIKSYPTLRGFIIVQLRVQTNQAE